MHSISLSDHLKKRLKNMSRVFAIRPNERPTTRTTSDEAWKSILSSVYRQTRFSSRRIRKRVIFKHGDVNVVQGNVAKRRRRYLQDIFTTLVDAQWRWTLLVFSLNFLLSWLLFAIIWWLIALIHGDLNPENNEYLAIYYNVTFENPDWKPCVVNIYSFASCFLFSVETQHTIGYGSRSTSEECPEAIILMCIQSIVGVMIQAFMVGIVFVKLSRPIKRTHTLLFSRNAVICQRDGILCLMFRVGDMRKSHIIEAHVRAQLIRRRVTKEGELLPFHQEELQVGGDGEEDRIFFIWPTTIVHKIVPESPLYRLSAADMLRERFEIVVILEGIVESTGMTTQARSSYLPNEILWGHRFEALITFKKETGEYEVDYSLFNNTYEVETPLCSAYMLDKLIRIEYKGGSDISERGNYISSEIADANSIEKDEQDSTIIEVDDNESLVKPQEINILVDEPLIHTPTQIRESREKLNDRSITQPTSLPLTPLEDQLPTEIVPPSYHARRKENFAFRETAERVTLPRATIPMNPLDVPGPESRI